MKISTLIENASHPVLEDLQAEHGLSFYIEHDGIIFMSDVGLSGKFAENASILGVDISAVEALVVTHHHFDHGGGLGRYLDKNTDGKVYLRYTPNVDYVVEGDSSLPHYVGLDKEILAAFSDRITYIDKNQQVLPGVHLLVDILDNYPKPSGDTRLKMQIGSTVQPDHFAHELVTVILDEGGLVVLTGCAHNGVLNMVDTARMAFPDQPVKAVIGGFHLSQEDDIAVENIAEALLNQDIPRIYSGHCTGEKQMEILKQILGERLMYLHTGLFIEL